MRREMLMEFLLWSERYRKPTSYGIYVPEYIVVSKIQNGTIREKIDLRIKMPVHSSNLDSDLLKGFNPIITMLKACPNSSIVYSTEADFKLCNCIFSNVDGLVIKDEFILDDDEFRIITRGKPATNANSRRSHASKAVTSYLSGRYKIAGEAVGIEQDGKQIPDESVNKASSGGRHNEDTSVETVNDTIDKEIESTEQRVKTGFKRIKRSKLYHLDTCRHIKRANQADVEEVYEDEIDELRQCGVCFKLSDKKAKVKIPSNNLIENGDTADSNNKNNDNNIKPKEAEKDNLDNHGKNVNALGKFIVEICSKYGIYCEIIDTTIVILTAAGGWKFDYIKRPIELYHQNYKDKGNTIANLEYHLQKGEFLSPLDAIIYIINHDNKRISIELDKVMR